MLVKLTNKKGEDVWVNPVHVRAVRGRSDYSEIVIDPNYMVLKVVGAPADVAALLDAGMPPITILSDINRPQGD